MKVTNEIELYEVNGSDRTLNQDEFLIIENHVTANAMVVLNLNRLPANASEITVAAEDLRKALENATNIDR